MRAKGFVVALIGALVMVTVSGCGSSPPSDFFIMTPMAGADARQATAPGREPLSVGVGPVKIPDYLNRAQIVTRAGPNRLDVNEFHRWGGAFTSNLSQVIAQNLSVILGTDDVFVFPSDDPLLPNYRVMVSFTQLDGALGESVLLDARWTITGSKGDKQLAAARSVVREATNGGDYADYVAAQSRALEKLSREIASRIKQLLEAGD